jgi:hypothetical protein
MRRHSGENQVYASLAGKIAPGSFPFPEKKRVQTLPVHMTKSEGLQNQRLSVKMKDARVLAAVQARLGSKDEEKALDSSSFNANQLKVKKTISVSFAAEQEILQDRLPAPALLAVDTNGMDGARRQRSEMNMVTMMTMMNMRTIMMIENDLAVLLWRFNEGMPFS